MLTMMPLHSPHLQVTRRWRGSALGYIVCMDVENGDVVLVDKDWLDVVHDV